MWGVEILGRRRFPVGLLGCSWQVAREAASGSERLDAQQGWSRKARRGFCRAPSMLHLPLSEERPGFDS